jgi:hypothetical protein
MRLKMAKKIKTGFVAAEENVSRSAGVVRQEPGPTGEAANQLSAAASTAGPAPAIAIPPAQLENAMVRQILERQAVFGF